MNAIATIQARLGSSRLPKKIMKKIAGKSLLEWQIDRLKKSNQISDIIISTTDQEIDDEIQDFCTQKNIKYFRGPENDVLKRLTQTIQKYKIDLHVECFGDSPLPDYVLIDEMISVFRSNSELDFVSNSIHQTYPSGLEVNIFSGKTLIELNNKLDPSDTLREHGGYNIRRFPDSYKIYSHKADAKLHFPELSLEVDEQEDFELLENIINFFVNQKIINFTTEDIIKYVKSNPSLLNINKNVHRRWKDLENKSI